MKPEASVFFTKVIDYGLRFAASVLIARWLGPADKGVLTFATLVITWAVMFGNFSITDATIYSVGRGAFPLNQVAGVTFLFSVTAGLLYMGVLFALVGSGLVHWPVGSPQVFFVLLTLVPLQLLQNNLTGIVQGLNRFRAYNVLAVIRSGSFLACIIIAMWTAQNRLIGVVHALVWSTVVVAVLLLWYVGRLCQWRFGASWKCLTSALHFGLRGHMSVILENINLRLDQLVLGALINPVELGWYSVAVSLCEMPQLLPDSIGVVLFPRVAGNQTTAGSLTARACRITVLAMLVAMVALVAFGSAAIHLIYGEAFRPAIKPLLWLAPSLVFLSISKILTKYIYGVGRPHWGVWSTAASATVTISLIFPLVHRYGMVGAAATSTAAYAVGALCNLGLTVKLSSIPARDFLVPRKQDLRTNLLGR